MERVQDSLTLLRGCRLSPFDLVLEILDESKPEYSYHQTKFYKDGNEKLSKILDAIVSSGPGRSKLRTWMRRPVAVDLFGEVITQEITKVQKAELLPGIAAITPNSSNVGLFLHIKSLRRVFSVFFPPLRRQLMQKRKTR